LTYPAFILQKYDIKWICDSADIRYNGCRKLGDIGCMNKALEKYLHKEPKEAYWTNKYGKRCCQSVHGKSYVRYNEAVEQTKQVPVDRKKIIKYTTEYLNEIGIQTTDNPEYDPQSIDYDKIREEFELDDKGDLVWMKFTEDGYLGVVAVSNDVNFDMPEDAGSYDKKHIVYDSYRRKNKEEWVHNSSGIIVHKLGKEWDETFVLIFPLKGIPHGYTRSDVETVIGNMLIDRDVPILDYFSHMY
jgi:hypothetical protein